MKIWTHELLPAPVLVHEEDIGKTVDLADYGFMTDDVLYCSPFDCTDLPLKSAKGED